MGYDESSIEGIFVYRYLPIDEKTVPLRVLCASVVKIRVQLRRKLRKRKRVL